MITDPILSFIGFWEIVAILVVLGGSLAVLFLTIFFAVRAGQSRRNRVPPVIPSNGGNPEPR